MVLVDASVWVEHFRRNDAQLARLLEAADVVVHPFVIGELALGTLRDRVRVLGLFGRMPVAAVATHTEVLTLVERRHLAGRGIGYVDAHLLASAVIARARLWTRDERLAAVARELAVS